MEFRHYHDNSRKIGMTFTKQKFKEMGNVIKTELQ